MILYWTAVGDVYISAVIQEVYQTIFVQNTKACYLIICCCYISPTLLRMSFSWLSKCCVLHVCSYYAGRVRPSLYIDVRVRHKYMETANTTRRETAAYHYYHSLSTMHSPTGQCETGNTSTDHAQQQHMQIGNTHNREAVEYTCNNRAQVIRPRPSRSDQVYNLLAIFANSDCE